MTKRIEATGEGATIEEAIQDAVSRLPPERPEDMNPDELSVVKVESISILSGGIAGYAGQRRVVVSTLRRDGGAKGRIDVTITARPEKIVVNMMPSTVPHPTPRVEFTVTLRNTGDTDVESLLPSASAAFVRVMDGSSVVWQGPEASLAVVTPFKLGAHETREERLIWDVTDAGKLVGHTLTVTATAVATRSESAPLLVPVKAVH